MILYYISNSQVPSEKAHGYAIMKMCESFAVLGHSVTLVLPFPRKGKTVDPFVYYGIKKNFSITYVPTIDFGWRGPIIHWISFMLQTISFIAGLFFLRFKKGAMLYTRDLYALPFLRLRSHQLFFEVHVFHAREQSLRFLFRLPKKIITTTEHLKQRIVASGIPSAHVAVAHDAADLAIFQSDMSRAHARQMLHLPDAMPMLGYTGSLRTMGEDKGVQTVLEALPALIERYPTVLFVVVGGSARDIDWYKKSAETLGVLSHTRFVERVPLATLAVYQKACDVLVMPFPWTDHYAYSMSPLKMFEYMAGGRPIITSDLPSVREVLDETSAFFFAPGDKDDFVRAVATIVTGEADAQKKTHKATEIVAKHSWEQRAAGVLAFIGA